MAEYRAVCAENELLPGNARLVEVDGAAIAVFNVDGQYHATEDHCLHAGGPLHEGTLEGAVVTCPWHGWQFDVTDGRCGLHGTNLRCYPVRVHDGVVEVLA